MAPASRPLTSVGRDSPQDGLVSLENVRRLGLPRPDAAGGGVDDLDHSVRAVAGSGEIL